MTKKDTKQKKLQNTIKDIDWDEYWQNHKTKKNNFRLKELKGNCWQKKLFLIFEFYNILITNLRYN